MSCEGAVEVTLEQAIRDKYCLEDEDETEKEKAIKPPDMNETALSYRPGNCPVQRLSVVVLERKGVKGVGDVSTLTQLCPNVKELHLGDNSITHADDVCKILTALPSLKLFNLGQNPLDSSTFVPGDHSFNQLSTLVLNSTSISWAALEACLLGIQQLVELHLSMNKYSVVGLTEAFTYPNLKQLNLNDNNIGEWEEFIKLSHAFPNLQTLIASSNPVQRIPQVGSDIFPSLSILHLNHSCLSLWQCIEHLHELGQLKELSVLKIPLGADMEEKQRRQAFVARLPGIAKLNKSAVTETERETAERWLLREMRDLPDPPAVYQDLLKKHGQLEQLADVNLNPVKMVTLGFVFWDEKDRREERSVNVDQTVWDFRKWIAKHLVGMPVSSFRVYSQGRPMNQNRKYLYSYRFFDGDDVQIEYLK